MEHYDVAVIGAGASGLVAAWQASRGGARVVILEKNRKAGVKLSITGKGRCNITNTAGANDYYKKIYPRGRFLKHAFSQFFTGDIINLLEQAGVDTTEERGGRVFPSSGKAADVTQALIEINTRQQVDFLYESRVKELVLTDGGRYRIDVERSGKVKPLETQTVIVCTGGKSYPATGSTGDGYELVRSLGHTVTPLQPALVPVETQEIIPARLVDLTLKNVSAVLWLDGKKQQENFGEMFFTRHGLSGPIILTLSQFIVEALHQGREVKVTLDLKPALDEKKLDNRLLRDLDRDSKKQMANLFRQWLPSALIPWFMDQTGIDPSKEAHQLSAKERKRIKVMMKALPFHIKAPRPFTEAIITAGGVSTLEVDSKTMESKLHPNLYFAGEILDLHGDTGGYNLQIAWSTGWLAGKSAGEKMHNT
jgi:predicted Rossmann fold flavoprotein